MVDNEQVADFLEHYGVKGMKWGTRRAAVRDVRRSKIAAARKGAGSKKARDLRAKIEERSALDPTYAKVAAKRKKQSLQQMRDLQKLKAGTIAAGALYLANDPKARKMMKQTAVTVASVAGSAYRRAGESEVQRIIRQNAYRPRDGATVVDAYSRVAGETLRFAGALRR